MSNFDSTPFVTAGKINTVVNGIGPNFAYMSLDPNYLDKEGRVAGVDLVIGANASYRCASAFDKRSLIMLAAILTKIADNMADS